MLLNVSKGQQDAALSSAAFSASTNKLLGPIKGQFGYYVLEVTKIIPAKTRSLAQSSALIKQTLLSQLQSAAQTAVNNHAKQDWLSKTQCQSAYAMADCKGYKAPKASPAAAAAAAGAAGAGAAARPVQRARPAAPAPRRAGSDPEHDGAQRRPRGDHVTGPDGTPGPHGTPDSHGTATPTAHAARRHSDPHGRAVPTAHRSPRPTPPPRWSA